LNKIHGKTNQTLIFATKNHFFLLNIFKKSGVKKFILKIFDNYLPKKSL